MSGLPGLFADFIFSSFRLIFLEDYPSCIPGVSLIFQINLTEREGGKFSDVMLTFFFFYRSPELQVLEIPREREKVICEMILCLLGFL